MAFIPLHTCRYIYEVVVAGIDFLSRKQVGQIQAYNLTVSIVGRNGLDPSRNATDQAASENASIAYQSIEDPDSDTGP